MNSFVRVLLIFASLGFGLQCYGEEQKSDSFTHWDQIVSDLRTSAAAEIPTQGPPTYTINDVQISAGMDLSFTYISLTGDPRFEGSGLLKGVGLQFGIDLFTPDLQAEGAFRNYSSDSLTNTLKAQVREFELKLVNTRHFNYGTRLRLGLGMAARSLELSSRTSEGVYKKTVSSPSALFMIGFGRTFGRNLFIGPDISYRTAIAGEEISQNSLDLHLKATALF